MRSKDTESVNTADHTQHMLQGMEQVQNGKKISRRALMASLGMAGVAVASGGLVQTINAAGNPHDKIGELSDLQTTDKSNLVSAINENVADNASRVYNVKYPPAPLVAAVGDGVADDTTAIQAVINAANAAGSPGGAIVFFPPNSKYKVTSTLTVKAGVILRGGSRRSTIIKSYITDGSALFELPLPSPNTAGSTYFTYHMEDMRIEGYGTDGLGTGCGNAIHIADANKVHLSRLDVVNFPDATGIYYRSGAFHSLISECEVTGCDVGIDINGNTGNPNKVTMIHVVDSVFNGKTAAVNVYQSVQVSFQRCTIQDATDTSGTDTGIGALVQESDQIILKDCWFERTVHDSLKIRN
ncbi:MAG: hypothetical protein K0R28_6011, partial [Paenibacillus sp.]|nr:hypothetical protein [Paenibacillus sp.]